MENTIRNYKNEVILRFEKCGDNFTLEVPHKNKWLAIIRFLKKRGFKVTENEYYKKQYDCLSKYHKIGYKKDLALLMEIGSSFIKVEFGNIKNLWIDAPQSFWNNPHDERYTKLTYLENISIKLEVKKLMEFCFKYNHKFIPEEYSLTPEEYIINKLKINTHIHGKIECLEDIKRSITEDTYDYKYNSNDANGKKIICGNIKYFYDYHTRRLSVGTVWHNINNMWWVIVNGQKYNIAAFDLFDFDSKLPKRKPADKIELSLLISKFERKKDYLKCHFLKKQLDKI